MKTEESVRYWFGHTPSEMARRLYYQLHSVGHFKCGSDYCTMRSGLKNYLLIYTLSGMGTLVYRHKKYEVTPRSLMFIDCYEEQEYRTAPGMRWEFMYMHISGLNVGSYFKQSMKTNGPVVKNCGLETPQRMLSVYEDKKAGELLFESRASVQIAQLLATVITAPYRQLEKDSQRDWVTVVTDYIRRNFRRPVTVDELANLACLSKYHFIRSFKLMTGYSPYQYLLLSRLSYAKELLLTTTSSVEAISEQAGFESVSAFVTAFKRAEGVTPKKYGTLQPGFRQ